MKNSVGFIAIIGEQLARPMGGKLKIISEEIKLKIIKLLVECCCLIVRHNIIKLNICNFLWIEEGS